MKVPSLFLIAVFMAFISGCVGLQSMSPQDRITTQKIYVSESVKIPSEMFYWDRSRSVAAGLGAGLGVAAGSGFSSAGQGAAIGVGAGLGSVVGAQMAIAPSQRVLDVMKENDIDIGQIVRSQLIDEIHLKKKMVVVGTPESADGVMDIAIIMYGFGQTQGFSSVLYPVLQVEASITNKVGKVVWKQRDSILPLNRRNTVAHTFVDYTSTPTNLKEAFEVASKAVAEWIVEKMPKN